MSETPRTAIEALASVIEYAEAHGRLRYPGQTGEWCPGFEAARQWILHPSPEWGVPSVSDVDILNRLYNLASPAKEHTP